MQEKTLQLFNAIEENQYSRVKLLLEEGVPTTVLNERARTSFEDSSCLTYAIRYGSSKLVDLLLEYDAEIAKGRDGLTAIEFMAKWANFHEFNNHFFLDSWLLWNSVSTLAKKKKTDEIDAAGYGYALWAAVNCENYEVAKTLLEAGASPNKCKFAEYSTCLRKVVTASFTHHRLIHLLLQYGANTQNIPMAQCSPEAREILKQFLEKTRGLSDACKQGDLDKIRELINQGCPTLIFDKNPLVLAVETKNEAILSELLQAMPDVPLKITKINEALATLNLNTQSKCHTTLASALYRLQSELPQEKVYLLHHAIRCNRLQKVTEILEQMDSLDDNHKLDKILTKDPKIGKDPLEIALDCPNESSDSFLNGLNDLWRWRKILN